MDQQLNPELALVDIMEGLRACDEGIIWELGDPNDD
jgi:hypothetical protein